jgi:ATP-dependent Clp protease adaptor protein ClpS
MNGKENPQQRSCYASESCAEDTCILWLINDDFNTFEFVINTLMELCSHSFVQASQCVFITHNYGKCDVMRGKYDVIQLIASAMMHRGLTVKITC